MHQGSAGIGGTAVDVELQADDLRYTRDTVLAITAENTGQPIERIIEDSLRDRWYTAAAAVEYGFLDRVVDGFDEMLGRMLRHGAEHETIEQYGNGVRHVVMVDPDGNRIALAGS